VVLKEKPLSSKGKEPIPEQGLFHRGFLGVSSDPPPFSVESSIQGSKGDHSAASSTRLCEATELGRHSPASKSQRVYFRRVKDGIAKQLPPPLSVESSNQGSKGDHSAVSSTRHCEATELGRLSPASKSHRVYSWRVKDEIAKQLLKNKGLLTEVVADCPVEHIVSKAKGMRELKNLEAGDSRSSQAKC
jgi:hypothetical protein